MTWWYAVVEARHELQNPTSLEKIRLLGERLGLGPDSHVLDIASGKGGPALLLAAEYGCRLTCVERAPEFVAAAHERVAAACLEDRIEIVEADAATYEVDCRYDAALCLGATFVYGGLVPTLERLRVAAPVLAVGEPYWRDWPLPEAAAGSPERVAEEEWLPLPETVELAESTTGLRVVSLIASSEDDWDRYESLHWQALDEWLAANPGHAQADEFRARGAAERDRYLRWQRAVLGWAILVCRS
jgi:SAM-dependent methyltransferase